MLLVLDDNRRDAVVEATREAVQWASDRSEVPAVFVDLEARASFVKALSEGLPFGSARSVLRQATLGGAAVSRASLQATREVTTGANRNCAMLMLAGRRFLAVDDDTRAPAASMHGASTGVCWHPGPDPTSTWYYPDRAAALAAVRPDGAGILVDHEALLGTTPASLGIEDAPAGRVALTSFGTVGGMDVATSHERLLGEGQARAHFVADYERLRRTAEAVRGAIRLTLARPATVTTTHTGFDARELLPPFPPLGRAAGSVFASVLCATDPLALVAHVPRVIQHVPPPHRPHPESSTYDELTRPFIPAAMAAIVRDLGNGLPRGSPAHRMRELGLRLEALAGSRDRLHIRLRDAMTRAIRERIEALQARLDGYNATPSAWADDVRTCTSHLQAALDDPRYPAVRIDERLRHYGQLLQLWPDLFDAARSLDPSYPDRAPG